MKPRTKGDVGKRLLRRSSRARKPCQLYCGREARVWRSYLHICVECNATIDAIAADARASAAAPRKPQRRPRRRVA